MGRATAEGILELSLELSVVRVKAGDTEVWLLLAETVVLSVTRTKAEGVKLELALAEGVKRQGARSVFSVVRSQAEGAAWVK